jgi:hypothetical protein
MRTFLKTTDIRVSVSVLAVVVAALTAVPAQAQQRGERRSGPHDWSHGRVIATQFAPDLDRSLAKNWRTTFKHADLDQARVRRSMAGERFQMLKQRRDNQVLRPEAPHLDWNLRTGGYGSVIGYPAKYSFDIATNNCTDVIYFTVDQAGSASAVNVIGITNPYAGCTGNPAGATPTVKFGIRLGTGTATSAVPSLDGKILYVIESRTIGSGGMILHAINVDNITTNRGTYNFSTQVWSNAHVLAAPNGTPTSEQLFQITFTGRFNNLASPYLDYDANQLFFGDSSGRVHRVINANSTSASSAPNFPVSCGTAALQSPVFVNGQVIVTSADGKLYRIDTTRTPPYTCIASAQGGAGTGGGVSGGLSAPVVDVTNGKILVVTNNDAQFGWSGIGTFNLMFGANETATSMALLGSGSVFAPSAPSFDDAFWTMGTGNVYVAGTPTPNTTQLVRFPYNGLAVGTASGYAALARSGGASEVATSPVTEFLTASTLSNPDFIFVGGGGGNHRFINRIGSGFNGTDNNPVAMGGQFAVPGGVISGIIIDTRTAGVTGSMATANVYFGTVGIPSTTQSTIVQLAQQF